MAVFDNLGVKVPVVYDVFSSHEKERNPTCSFNKNCVKFHFQTDRIYYLDFRPRSLVLKLKVVKDRANESYNIGEF